jgi:hypothetical protein
MRRTKSFPWVDYITFFVIECSNEDRLHSRRFRTEFYTATGELNILSCASQLHEIYYLSL